MGSANSINLIPRNIENTPEFAGLYSTLRRLGYGSLIIFIVSGVLIGSVFAYLSAREQNLQAQKDSLTAEINRSSVNEGLLLTAKQRIAVINKIRASQKHLTVFFDLIKGIVSEKNLVGVSLDEKNNAVVFLHVSAIEDAIAVLDALESGAKSNALTKPALSAFTIPKDGGFDMSVSFVPKL